jgi:site-specific recombinase XerC
MRALNGSVDITVVVFGIMYARVIRQRVARNTQKPRINNITLTTFRHCGATMTYHYTKNILLVKKLLGYKRIKNTMKYTQLVQFEDDQFDVATATTIEKRRNSSL